MNRRSEESQVRRSKPSACPPDETLAALIEGKLDAEEVARLDAHVDGCEACQELLAAYARGWLDTHVEYASTLPDADRVSELQRAAGLAPGTRVGRYVVFERVGEGASGVVYAAHDPELDRKIAIKVLHRGIAEQDGQERLLKEARAMAKLSHPNVITVHEVGTAGVHERRVGGAVVADHHRAVAQADHLHRVRVAVLPGRVGVVPPVHRHGGAQGDGPRRVGPPVLHRRHLLTGMTNQGRAELPSSPNRHHGSPRRLLHESAAHRQPPAAAPDRDRTREEGTDRWDETQAARAW